MTSTNCGCLETCTLSVLNQVATDDAGAFTCHDRIAWVMENAGQTETEACVTVSNEFPNICGQGCNPNSCHGDSQKEGSHSKSSTAPEREHAELPPSHYVLSSASLLESSNRGKKILSSMSLKDKIGQMSQIEIAVLLEDGPDGEKQVNPEKLEQYFGKLGIGSLLNDIVGEAHSARDFRKIMIQIQDIAKKYNRPPVIWGLDSIHGANYVKGAIMSPQPINLAATFNTTTAFRAGQMASRDTRAAGISWLFSPLLGLALEPKWSRVYETFGEDPQLVGEFAAAMIAGIQQKENDDDAIVPSRAAACAKHFVGYSKPLHGHDRSPSWIPTRHLYQYFVPPWRRVLSSSNNKALTVMESYTETDGVPNVANRRTLHKLLRQQLEFDGVLVTDYKEILNLHLWHSVSPSNADATVHALREGSVDMSMIPFDADGFRSAIEDGIQKDESLAMARIDESVARVLALKEKLGMMDETLTMDNGNLDVVGQGRAEALDMAHQSIVLVQNRNETLPIRAQESVKIHVTGPTSRSLRYQSGGWTAQWQGAPSDDEWFAYGTTVVEALGNTSSTWHVTVSCGVDILGAECNDDNNKNGWSDEGSSGIVDTIEDWIGIGGNSNDASSIQRAAEQASHADYVIVCVGEENYAEKPGDIRSLSLSSGQYELVRALEGKAKHIILVYFGGRTRLLYDMVDIADSVFVAFLPGPDAGRAVANLIAGIENPSGRLPMTYPKFEDGAGGPYFSAVSDQCTSGAGELPHDDIVPCEVQWPFGHGLGYTSFEYSALTVDTDTLRYRARGRNGNKEKADDLTISIDVKNTGTRVGAETVMFFTFDESRMVTPERKRLRAFEKVSLREGESKTVSTSININDLRFVGAHDDSHYVLQHGLRFRVGVGAETDCRASDVESNPLCSSFVTIDTGGEDGGGACDAACTLWAESGCGEELNLSPTLCWNLCTSDNAFRFNGARDYDGWGWNYVDCIESAVGTEEGGTMQNQCWKMTTLCRNIFSDDTIAAPPFQPVEPTRSSILVALLAGILGSTAVALAFVRGGKRKRSRWRNDDEDIAFSVVDGDDGSDEHSFT